MNGHVNNILTKLSLILFLPFLGFILYLNYTDLFDCYYQDTSSHIIYALVAGTFLLFCALYLMFRCSQRLNERILAAVPYCVLGIMAVIQLFLIFTTFKYGLPGADAQSVISESFTMAESSIPMISSSGRYFEMYANNYFITILLCWYFKLFHFFGIHSYWMELLFLNMIAMDAGVFFCIQTIKQMKGAKTAAVAAVMCLFNPSVYIFIPFIYTNTLSIPFITSIFYFAILIEKAVSVRKRFLYCIAGTSLLIIGFNIRVTTMIPFIALMIYYCLRGNIFQNIRENAKYIIAAIITAVIVSAGCTKIIDAHVSNDLKAGNFPVTHWVMMGFQGEGRHYTYDEDYTWSFPTKEEKTEANIERLKIRVQELVDQGPAAVLEFFALKIKSTWASLSDGIYLETGWLHRYSSLQPYLYGDKNDIIIIYYHLHKLLTFTLCFAGIFFELNKKKASWTYPCLLTFFGFVIFYLIWEANCRYAIFVTLLFTMTACLSMSDLMEAEEKISSFTLRHIYMPMKTIIGILFAVGVLVPSMFFMYKQYPVYTQTPYVKNQMLINTLNRKYNDGIVDNILSDRQILKQTFTADRTFNEIAVYCKYIGDEKWDASMRSELLYHFALLDSEGNILGESDFASEGSRSYFKLFGFEPVTPTEPTEYTICITPYEGVTTETEDRIGFYYFDYPVYDYIPGGNMAINGETMNQDMVFRVSCKYEDVYTSSSRYALSCLLIILLFIVIDICLLNEKKFLCKTKEIC